jgi:hypothetical protein
MVMRGWVWALLMTSCSAQVTERAQPAATRRDALASFPEVEEPVSAPNLESQGRPAIAYGNGQFLVVWEDYRDDIGNVMGARFSAPSVTLLDPFSLAISDSPVATRNPEVGFDGTDFVVAWEDSRGTDTDIRVARVSAAGVVSRPSTRLTSPPGDETGPSIADMSGGVLIGWTSNGVGAALLSSDGGTSRFDVLLDAGFLFDVEVNRNTALFAVDQGGQSRVVLHDLGAGFTRAPVAFSSAAVSAPRARAANPDGGFLLHYEVGSGSSASVRATRVTSAGVVLDMAGLDVAISPGAQSADAVFTGSAWLVTYLATSASGRIAGTAVSTTGVVPNPTGIFFAPSGVAAYSPRAAYGAGTHLVVWEDQSAGSYDIHLAANPLNPTPALQIASNSATTQLDPSAAASSDRVLVIWSDYRDPSTLEDVRGRFFDFDGGALAPSFLIERSPGKQSQPGVASDGTRFLVTWTSREFGNDDIAGAFVEPSAQVGSRFSIASTATPERGAQAVFNGVAFVVSYTANSIPQALYLQSGFPPVMAPVPLSASAISGQATIATNGSASLVVFPMNGDAGLGADLFGVRVSASGSVLDQQPQLLVARPGNQSSPSIAWSGTEYLLAWIEPGGGIGATRIDDQLVAAPAFTISATPSRALQASGLPDGGVGLLWVESGKLRFVTVHAGLSSVQDLSEMYGAQAGGMLVNAAPRPMVTFDDFDRTPTRGSYRSYFGLIPPVAVDGGGPDAGVGDGGIDGGGSGVGDGGAGDAGVGDGGAGDAGGGDGGDGDAGVADASVGDGGGPDAGMDAGLNDSGVKDAGTDGTPRAYGVGCGCSSVDLGSVVGVLLAANRFRRRRLVAAPR